MSELNNYFSSTLLKNWTAEKVSIYFMKKNVRIENTTGVELYNIKLKELHKLFGQKIGDRIYIIIKSRIDKENEALDALDVFHNNSYQISISPGSSPPDNQSTRYNIEDIERKNETSHKLDLFKKHELHCTLIFIATHPPILWQNEHLECFIKLLGCDYSFIRHIDIDDFIFMSSAEIDLYFPSKGAFIYEALRCKFINPYIQKIKGTSISNKKECSLSNEKECSFSNEKECSLSNEKECSLSNSSYRKKQAR